MRLLLLTLALLTTCSCAGVTIRANHKIKNYTKPNFESSENYYFMGLAGESHINTENICPYSGIEQIHITKTFTDNIATTLTGGLFSPITYSIWCKPLEEV